MHVHAVELSQIKPSTSCISVRGHVGDICVCVWSIEHTSQRTLSFPVVMCQYDIMRT